MKFIDLFAGIGGFRMGMEMAGHECVGWVESDPKCEKCKKITKHIPSEKRNFTICTVCGKEKRQHARFSYEAIHNTEGEWSAYDITAVSDHDIRLLRGKVDVICGGFPCQAFSVAGKRRGFLDTRGTLFFDIARFAEQIKPRFLFLENVKGLLSHEEGKTFAIILSTLDELGYDAEWQMCNSSDFGVPQSRERVFIIGHLRGERRREVFPIRTAHTKASLKLAGNLNYYNFDASNRVYSPEGLSPTLSTMQGSNRHPKIIQPILTPNRLKKRQNGRRMKEPGEPMFTLTAQDKHGIYDGKRVRRLTPKECWRLQGFLDSDFEKAAKVNADSNLYKQAGNTVTVNVIYEIAKRLA